MCGGNAFDVDSANVRIMMTWPVAFRRLTVIGGMALLLAEGVSGQSPQQFEVAVIRPSLGWHGRLTVLGISTVHAANRSLTVAVLFRMSRVCSGSQNRDREGAVDGNGFPQIG